MSNARLKPWEVWLVVVVGWLLFPLLALWLMLTHPGKCAWIWKMELTGAWWSKPARTAESDSKRPDRQPAPRVFKKIFKGFG